MLYALRRRSYQPPWCTSSKMKSTCEKHACISFVERAIIMNSCRSTRCRYRKHQYTNTCMARSHVHPSHCTVLLEEIRVKFHPGLSHQRGVRYIYDTVSEVDHNAASPGTYEWLCPLQHHGRRRPSSRSSMRCGDIGRCTRPNAFATLRHVFHWITAQ